MYATRHAGKISCKQHKKQLALTLIQPARTNGHFLAVRKIRKTTCSHNNADVNDNHSHSKNSDVSNEGNNSMTATCLVPPCFCRLRCASWASPMTQDLRLLSLHVRGSQTMWENAFLNSSSLGCLFLEAHLANMFFSRGRAFQNLPL